MTELPYEPVYAGAFEEVAVDSTVVAAFPRGRRTELEGRTPSVSFLAVVDGAALALDDLPLPVGADVEVVVVDNASEAFAACLRYADAAPNRTVYRLPKRLPRSEAWAVADALARGETTSDAVPRTRELAVAVDGADVVADPSLLARWRDAFGPATPASLVVVLQPAAVDGLVRALASIEADGGEVGDVVAVVAHDVRAELERIAPLCRATLLTPVAGARCIGPERLATLA